jgi:DNA polymerase sigma
MPYSLGSDLLPEEPGPIKQCLESEVEEKLSADLLELYNTLLPSEESEERRARFVRKLENLLNSKWPGNDIKVHVFGSSGNKLCSSDSDGKFRVWNAAACARKYRVHAEAKQPVGLI